MLLARALLCRLALRLGRSRALQRAVIEAQIVCIHARLLVLRALDRSRTFRRALLILCLLYAAARMLALRAAVRLIGDDPSEMAAGLGFLVLCSVIVLGCVGVGGRP